MNNYRYITTSGRSGYYKQWNEASAYSIQGVLEYLFEDLVRIWDAVFVRGEEKFYVRIYDVTKPDEESYHCIEYSWYIDYDPEWNLVDDVNYILVDLKQIPDYDKDRLIGDRDWMIL